MSSIFLNMAVDKGTYSSWHNMRQRCLNPGATAYERYGGQGITVCARWKSFANFLADMGVRPEGMSIDRIDNRGNYEPGNCRWATAVEQARHWNQTMPVSPHQLELLDRLIGTMQGHPRWSRVLHSMRDQLTLPMQDVLERVPGQYIRDKIAAIGCVRTTYYDWMRESYRPGALQAKRLAELTGLPAEQIRGHQEDGHDLGRETAQTSVAVAKGRAAASGVHGGGGGAPGRVVSSPGRGRGVRALRRRAHRRPSKGKDEQ